MSFSSQDLLVLFISFATACFALNIYRMLLSGYDPREFELCCLGLSNEHDNESDKGKDDYKCRSLVSGGGKTRWQVTHVIPRLKQSAACPLYGMLKIISGQQ